MPRPQRRAPKPLPASSWDKSEPIDWEKAGKCFERMVKREAATIKRLCDAATYADYDGYGDHD